MRFVLSFVALVCIAVLSASAQDSGRDRIYGYKITVENRDGKPFSDGKYFRVIVIEGENAARDKVAELRSIHVNKVDKHELKSQAEYDAAVREAKDPDTGKKPRMKAEGVQLPKNPVIAGSQYALGSTTFTFSADGSVKTNYDTVGKWVQDGNQVKWMITDGFEFYYTGTVSGSGEMMTVKQQSYNPATGNSSQVTDAGTARRTEK